MKSKNYLDVVYDQKEKPFTTYPKKLVSHLIRRFNIEINSKVLDVCCGRGEFINEFINLGLEGHGVDINDTAKKHFPALSLKLVDLEKDKLPYNDNEFDIVFNKSVVEHFLSPEKIIKECYRVLKPGGIIITMTPSWEHNLKNFYDDFTHKQPFNLTSIKDLHKTSNFSQIKAEHFIQLPQLWKKNVLSKILYFISLLTRIYVPNSLKKNSKFVFFSKEIMILCSAKK